MTTLNIVAHPDDDLLFMNPDIAEDILLDSRPHIVYLTAGDDRNGFFYARRKQDASRRVFDDLMVGMRWVGLRSNSFKEGDVYGDLYKMWNNPEYVAEYGGYSDSKKLTPRGFTRDMVLEEILDYISSNNPSLIRIQDPDCEPNLTQDSPHGDHVDHIYGARFAQEACKAFPHIPVYAYTSYPIRFMPPNLNAHQIELKTKMWRAYQSVDTSVAGEQWDIALSRCYKRRIQ